MRHQHFHRTHGLSIAIENEIGLVDADSALNLDFIPLDGPFSVRRQLAVSGAHALKRDLKQWGAAIIRTLGRTSHEAYERFA